MSSALAAPACGGGVVDATLFGDGGQAGERDGGRGAAEPDVSASPEQRPPPASRSDAGAPDGGDAGVDADPVAAPAPAGFVQCGAATCDLHSQYCCGGPDSTRTCVPLDAGCIVEVLKCDSTSDCPEGEFCRLIGQGSLFSATCLRGNVGFPKEYPNGEFQILACDPDPTPPYAVCPAGAPCVRQTCRGLVFDLCGEIPDGGNCDL